MTHLTLSITLGIVSGVITSALIFSVAHMFGKIILPWYQSIIYHGVDLSGKWEQKLELSSGITQTSSILIIQHAHKISGEMTIVKSNDDGEILITEMLCIDGKIEDRLFYAIINSSDNKRIALATLLLEVIGSGNIMRGATTWYDSFAGSITSENVKWNRQDTKYFEKVFENHLETNED